MFFLFIRLKKRLQEKKQQQIQKMLVGDTKNAVFTAANKQDVVTCMDEVPSYAFEDGTSMVCSCDDLNTCYQMYKSKLKKETRVNLKKTFSRKRFILDDKGIRPRRHFSILRRPTQIKHLSNHLEKCDFILATHLDKTEMEIKRLAIESDFISHKKVKKRRSI